MISADVSPETTQTSNPKHRQQALQLKEPQVHKIKEQHASPHGLTQFRSRASSTWECNTLRQFRTGLITTWQDIEEDQHIRSPALPVDIPAAGTTDHDFENQSTVFRDRTQIICHDSSHGNPQPNIPSEWQESIIASQSRGFQAKPRVSKTPLFAQSRRQIRRPGHPEHPTNPNPKHSKFNPIQSSAVQSTASGNERSNMGAERVRTLNSETQARQNREQFQK
ncbi:hypothetical protein K504DRAFT_505883 [Pleomassaria siparia CBS 279.74]|uniref:Uncharacterized protein n=1 Tax=Pleomassaria siparia CBS 279.74 TaxID=1314801 RepID=A0A6G1JZ45_9PLEO|nr:hypothetical protein K504DRAFT_505883 [Pleomassaria siparia CBS 279.74]